MTSVLAEYINANILLDRYQDTSLGIQDGRITRSNVIGGYVLQCFLSRNDTPSGDFLDAISDIANNSGLKYIASGYILRYAQVSSNFNIANGDYGGLNFIDLNNGPPEWLHGGITGQIMFGQQGPSVCTIEIASGRYGSMGIDRLVYSEISGIKTYVTVSELRTTRTGANG